MSEHKVRVWSEEVAVSTYQKSKSVWIATGDYLGQTVEVKAATQGAALTLWRSTAEYRGNG